MKDDLYQAGHVEGLVGLDQNGDGLHTGDKGIKLCINHQKKIKKIKQNNILHELLEFCCIHMSHTELGQSAVVFYRQ